MGPTKDTQSERDYELQPTKPPKEESLAEDLANFLGDQPLEGERLRWWEVMANGAVRTNERLHRAGIINVTNGQVIEPECPFCASRAIEDFKHIFIDCPGYEHLRRPHRVIIGNISMATTDLGERNAISDISNWPIHLRTHGLMPDFSEDPNLWLPQT